ncbi:MAG: 3-methyladenine DNA glycosylase [Planctomycetes bacterium]|nr:3-methyladenine DNA glycosylase [Planctomycetota bacterium]
MKHPVHDFLFEYYSFRPSELMRWSPGVDVLLEDAVPGEIEWRDFVPTVGGLILRADSFPDRRVKFLRWALGYLEGIANRLPAFACFGLHEWAMVYRAPEVRHTTTPLRLSAEEIARLVEAEGVRCTHYDAFRFFTPEAAPLNRLQLTRVNTDEYDQKGCLHVTMDLYKYAYKIAPWSSGELIADAFLLAWDTRQIDMRASPYDLCAYGVEPIRIETRDGREEYVECQRALSQRGEAIRERLIEEYRKLLEAKGTSEDACAM